MAPSDRAGRRGVATVELSAVLPMLCFMALMAIDFSRAARALVVVNNCARNGAIYQCDPTGTMSGGYSSASQAALADAADLTDSTPTVTTASGTDSSGNSYVEVTVTYTFKTIVTYPGIPSSTTLQRTVRMMVAP